MAPRVPDWQLPRGVNRGLWEYAQAEHIAYDYDDYFADNRLFEFDEQVLLRHFTRPGVLVDLGCGTGRLLVPLAQRGFTAIGVDLSRHMLEVAAEKADLAGATIHRVQANLVELDCLRPAVADYAILMFSTLGMIHPRDHRLRVLEQAYRILKPGGLLGCHVHNRWYNLFDPQGRRWLVRNRLESWLRREVEWGDKMYDYRGIPRMKLHVFSEGEFRGILLQAGFRLRELLRLDTHRHRPLRWPRLAGAWRANGWIAVCQKPA